MLLEVIRIADRTQLSRSDVIETWSKTLTRIGEIICVHDTVLTARGICGKIAYTGYKDEGERLRCEQIDEWLRKVKPVIFGAVGLPS